jgi:hypothetical protein
MFAQLALQMMNAMGYHIKFTFTKRVCELTIAHLVESLTETTHQIHKQLLRVLMLARCKHGVHQAAYTLQISQMLQKSLFNSINKRRFNYQQTTAIRLKTKLGNNETYQ